MMKFTQNMLEKELEFCVSQVEKGLSKYRYCYFPTEDKNNIYKALPNCGWTGCFWSGMVWLAYELTGEQKFRDVGESHINSYTERIINEYDINHHDLGFEYTLSCVAAYKITGNETAKKTALAAADKLLLRYEPHGKFIKPWGEMDDPVENRIIVDTYLNLPLLFWATEVTGDNKYKDVAIAHLETTVDILVRDDGRAYHTYMMELKYGNPIMPKVDQGYADDSVWSRGQAWVIYGLALAYSYLNDKQLKEVQKKVTNKFIELLPIDDVPAWDMVFTDTKTMKDTSASAIAVCGMLEMNKLEPNHEDYEKWNNKSNDMIYALSSKHTTRETEVDTTAILIHGTSSYRHHIGVNESIIYGDYFYMESLMRMYHPTWNRYW